MQYACPSRYGDLKQQRLPGFLFWFSTRCLSLLPTAIVLHSLAPCFSLGTWPKEAAHSGGSLVFFCQIRPPRFTEKRKRGSTIYDYVLDIWDSCRACAVVGSVVLLSCYVAACWLSKKRRRTRLCVSPIISSAITICSWILPATLLSLFQPLKFAYRTAVVIGGAHGFYYLVR